MAEPTVATKLRANLDYLRKSGASKERIQEEIQRAQQAMERVSADERKLSGAEKVAATGSKLASGATFGLFDELSGDKDTQRFLQKGLEEENPALAFGAEVLGGLAVPGSFLKAAPKLAKGASLLARTGRRARQAGTVLAEGALQGGVSGAGNAEGSLEDRIRGAASGAKFGAVTAGAISGVGRGIGAARRAAAKGAGVYSPSLDDLVRDLPDDIIKKGNQRFNEVNARGLGDELMVADAVPGGEGSLRAAGTANKETRRTIDTELRSRSNRLANLADDRMSQHTGTQRQSARRSVDELNEEARTRARPFYDAADKEGRAIVRGEAFPRAGKTVDGRTVGEKIDNTASISSSFDDWRETSGIREVPMSAFDYTPSKSKRIDELAARIAESGRVDPLIVALDAKGPYILEGSHRIDALHKLGAKSFPAMVVQDEAAMALSDKFDEVAQLPFVSAAIKRIQKSADYKDLAPDDHRVLDQAYKEIGEDIRLLKAKKSANNLSTTERREMMDLIDERTKLKEAIASRAPSYPKALSEFADPMARVDAYKQGSKDAPADMIASELADLNPAQASSYKDAKAQKLRAKQPNPDVGAFARFHDVLAPVLDKEKSDIFRATFGDKAYREYLADLLEMAKMQKMRAGGGESTTADKLLEVMQAGGNADLGPIIEAMSSMMPGGNALLRAARAMSSMTGVSRLLASQKNADQNAQFLMRRGGDVPRTLDEIVRRKLLGQRPVRPARLRGNWSPSLEAVKDASAREAGAISGRR